MSVMDDMLMFLFADSKFLLMFFMHLETFPGYDAAVYSAASSYYHQQQAAKAIGTWAAKKPGTQPFKPKPKGPPKTPQLHYCDVCKISCAGPQVSELGWVCVGSGEHTCLLLQLLPYSFLKTM